MKAILVIDMPDGCDKCPIAEMRWSVNGENICYRHCPLRPLPQKKNSIIHQGKINKEIPIEFLEKAANQGYNACIDEILSQRIESVENALEITDEEADCCGVQFWHDD